MPLPSGGYAQLDVNNCNTDVDSGGQHRSISIYLLDQSLPGSAYFSVARGMKAQYSDSGCPYDENGQPANPESVKLYGHNGWNNNHVFTVVIVDPGAPTCDGQDDPLNNNCIRFAFQIRAKMDGDTFTYMSP